MVAVLLLNTQQFEPDLCDGWTHSAYPDWCLAGWSLCLLHPWSDVTATAALSFPWQRPVTGHPLGRHWTCWWGGAIPASSGQWARGTWAGQPGRRVLLCAPPACCGLEFFLCLAVG